MVAVSFISVGNVCLSVSDAFPSRWILFNPIPSINPTSSILSDAELRSCFLVPEAAWRKKKGDLHQPWHPPSPILYRNGRAVSAGVGVTRNTDPYEVVTENKKGLCLRSCNERVLELCDGMNEKVVEREEDRCVVIEERAVLGS